MSEIRFDGRVAVVTGAGAGLGREHALLLAARGASVVVADVAAAAATGVVAEIEGAGGRAVAAPFSVSESTDGERIVATAVDAFGRVDIVINNAGITRDRTFANLSDDELDAVLRVHLYGAFNVTRPAWRLMREQGYGRVLNTSSNAGILGNFGQTNYGAAKMGLVGLTRVLALEGAKYGIRVNALAPMAKTAMTEEVFAGTFDALDPALVAPVAAWLVHEDCPVTGEIYSAAGGRVARFVIGLTRGFHASGLTIEDVRYRFGEARDPEGLLEPSSALDEIELVRSVLA
jgi:NAD(P)-dependent dehydrogenase (short-subunit alcohol dehydrogenase family)